MSSKNSSRSSTSSFGCSYFKQGEFYRAFNQVSLGPAAVIIMVLLFLTKRTKFKKGCLNGRPGLQVPVDFLGEEENRFSYAIAYGGMAIAVTNMFTGTLGVVFVLTGPPYIKVFQSLVTVVCIGTIYLPFFMCLSTDAKLLGAVMGFLYTCVRGTGLILMTLMCPIDYRSRFIFWPLFHDAPAILSHLILMVRYLVIFVMEVRDKCRRKKLNCSDLLGDECDFRVGDNSINHVKTLLQGVPKTAEQKWYLKGRNFVYTPEPHFKYSVTILSSVIVAGIIIYEILITGTGSFLEFLLLYKDLVIANKLYFMMVKGEDFYEALVKLINVTIVCFLVTLYLSAFYTYFQMYRSVLSHRNHVIKLIKGDRSFLPNKLSGPHFMVGMSLRFAGYQVAYFLWGFIIMTFVLLLVTLSISAGVLLLPTVLNDDSLSKQFSQIIIATIPTVAMGIFIFLLQQILARYVFKNRSMDSKVISIHNRRLFMLVSFFFFFFNILVGLLSCLLRVLAGMVIGVLFIGRIDRPLIMKGFTWLDLAYSAYIGFVHLQVAHKHPVVRVFAHLLWSGMRRKQQERLRSAVVDISHSLDNHGVVNGWTELKQVKPVYPRVSASALNKWFIAVTVIHNPVLIYNRKGFLKHILLGIPNSPTPSTDGRLEITSPAPSKEYHANSIKELRVLELRPTNRYARNGASNMGNEHFDNTKL